jgi:hypothetical protein
MAVIANDPRLESWLAGFRTLAKRSFGEQITPSLADGRTRRVEAVKAVMSDATHAELTGTLPEIGRNSLTTGHR